MHRRSVLAALGSLTATGLAGCSTAETVISRNETSSRAEFGPLTDGVEAIEWQDDASLRVEATDDATWQGIAVVSPNDEFLDTRNKDPLVDEITVQPLSDADMKPGSYTLGILEREITVFEVDEIDWEETINLDLEPAVDFDARYDDESNALALDVTNTGESPVVLKELRVETDFGKKTTPIPNKPILPGETVTATPDELPWPVADDCPMVTPELSANLVTIPLQDFETETKTGVEEPIRMCTISL